MGGYALITCKEDHFSRIISCHTNKLKLQICKRKRKSLLWPNFTFTFLIVVIWDWTNRRLLSLKENLLKKHDKLKSDEKGDKSESDVDDVDADDDNELYPRGLEYLIISTNPTYDDEDNNEEYTFEKFYQQ